MAELTMTDLAGVLQACSGVDYRTRVDGDFADAEFLDLGCDSLAVLEAASRLTRDYGVEISDDDLGHLRTPRDLLALVQGRLAEAA